jgi:hypothetical protein
MAVFFYKPLAELRCSIAEHSMESEFLQQGFCECSKEYFNMTAQAEMIEFPGLGQLGCT